MANVWIAVDGFAECETRQKQVITVQPVPEHLDEEGNTVPAVEGKGYIVLYRREVFVTAYERHSHQPSFVFGPMVSEVTLLGSDDTDRVVKHGWRKSFITGKVVEFKELHKAGQWKKAGVYQIEALAPPE